MEDQAKDVAQHFLGEWGWLIIVGFIALLFRTTLESAIQGLIVFIGNDFNNEDVILLDGRPARIIRKSLWRTTFYVYMIQGGMVIGGYKRVVNNEKLRDSDIQKPLPKIDLDELYAVGMLINGTQTDHPRMEGD